MFPYLEINLDKLIHNTQVITEECRRYGISVFGVTKASCGMPEVGLAMLQGGVDGLADSRLMNLSRLRDAGIKAPLMLLRSPALSEIEDVVSTADISLNSELVVLEHLSRAAVRQGAIHKVVLMTDLGDLREGVWDDAILKLFRQVQKLPNIKIWGIGTNLACYSGILPSAHNMQRLVELAEATGVDNLMVSAGNSSALHLMRTGGWAGDWVKIVNHLRIGESIFLGWDITDKMPLPGCYQDACLVYSETIEVQYKPSAPQGTVGPDAFGDLHEVVDKGERKRAVLALGRQDIGAGSLIPLESGIEILGASSDHLIIDVHDYEPIEVGRIMRFRMDYAALLALFTSPYVAKKLTVNIADPAPL